MKPLYQAPITAKPSTIHGYGVFADVDIEKNAVIEECHILIMHDFTALFNYLFSYKQDGKNQSCLPLGYGALYNHSDEPNAEYAFNEENSLLVFTALRPIKAGEEIFITYGSNWFASRHAKPLQSSLMWSVKRMIAKSSFILRALFCMAAVYAAIIFFHAIQT